jgi:ATP-binding cassette subfamily B protein/subfamily B ATP-binding cassette protein MsbA
MKNFCRVLRVALRNRLILAGVFGCSLMVALLWGANIGMIYPVVEIISRDESTHQLIDSRIEETKIVVAKLRGELTELRDTRADADRDAHVVDRQIAQLEGRLSAEEKALATQQTIRPYVHKYLPDDPFHMLVVVIAFLLVGAVAKNLALLANAILVARLGQATLLDMRRQFFAKILELDLALHGRTGSGRLIRRIMGDVNGVIGGIGLLVGRTLREPLKLAVCLGGACFISWRLLLVSLLLAPPTFFLMTLLAKMIRRTSRQLMEETAEFYQRLTESFSSISIVKAFTMESYQQKQFDRGCGELYRKSMKEATFKSFASPVNELLAFGVIGFGLLSGGYLVLRQDTHLFGIQMLDRPMSFGTLIVYYAFLVGVSDPARKLSRVFTKIQGSLAAADRVYELLDTDPQVKDPEHPQPLGAGRERIVFDDVSFQYSEDNPVLRRINLTIDSGESLAIVGPNGCGKSTLINLMLRFYDPAEGAIRIGDIDLRDVLQHDLRGRIGLVTQDTMLFDDTVMNNIRFGSMDASDDDVIEAAKKAHAHQFIESVLAHGYHTSVGHGGNRLSGGQRQRIALARAILRDPDILVLDEATSQIDPESEQAIHQALKGFIRGRTTIMITHRMSTLDLADRILVMDAGQVVGLGNHEELVARCTTYRQFRQSSEIRKSA